LAWDEGFEVVAVNGRATARMLPRPVCPFCGGAGRREVTIDGAPRIVRCRCQMLPDRVVLFNAAQIPARYAHCTMESFRLDQEGAEGGWRVVRSWLDEYRPGRESRGLVLTGPPGRGKTHLLCAALRELVFRHGISCRYIEFTHLVASIREAVGRGAESVALTALAAVPMLLIDELGNGRSTEWEVSIIDEIITRRYNGGLPILGSSNFPFTTTRRRTRVEGTDTLATEGLPPLSERIGDRAFSRLKETCTLFIVGGADFRMTRGR